MCFFPSWRDADRSERFLAKEEEVSARSASERAGRKGVRGGEVGRKKKGNFRERKDVNRVGGGSATIYDIFFCRSERRGESRGARPPPLSIFPTLGYMNKH